MNCNVCGGVLAFLKRCRPRKTRSSNYTRTKSAIWYKCEDCGRKQFVDQVVSA